MKIMFLSILSILVASEAFATTTKYDIKFELSVDGKTVATPRVITVPNQKATVTQRAPDSSKETKIEVTASDISNEQITNGILMNLAISFTSGAGRNISSKSSIITRENSLATVVLNKNNNQGKLNLKVIAFRTQ